jgi:two-component system, chemotaxis family, response regulator Rcp1
MNAERMRLVQILLVEDSPADIELTREALADVKLANDLHVARDGVEALDFLHKRNGHEGAPRPDLILLDLNLPRKDGRAVLEEVKNDSSLRRIPVVVLTTSGEDEDILRAYDLQVNSYIRKPVGLDRFVEVVRSLENYWLGIVTLPPE